MVNYVPQVLYNPKNTTVEFMCGGRVFVFEPREHKPLDGFVAHHALNFINTGLVPFNVDVRKEDLIKEKEEEIQKLQAKDYKKMPWKKLLKIASELGVYKIGANREDLEREIAKKIK